ncbi:MAG: T9SS type A sorting domain-containing protein, partial [Aliifodinibius sp.]|nr:T9SS type A sorting domain-containing protein [Fodinibius sp.]NIV12942.1 T9SS type A sorting domain-containing protein [Fodinibius sp.]NIY23555.1 T9SS type A sorting domain-containing protein [Fodinibius sp.]
MSQNYPNPFNPSTTIEFALKEDEFTTLKVFDITGREVATLVNEKMRAGHHSVSYFNPDLASGIYVYQIKSKDFV